MFSPQGLAEVVPPSSPYPIDPGDDGWQAFSAGALGPGPQVSPPLLLALRPDQPQQLPGPGPLEAVAKEVAVCAL